MENILEVKNLTIDFMAEAGDKVSIVRDLCFEVSCGEILAIVGESGCGKSISCMALTNLLDSPPAIIGGEILFRHNQKIKPILKLSKSELRKVRGGGIAYIFQDSASSLNPVMTVGDQIAEAIYLHRGEVDDVRREIVHLFKQVGIPEPETRVNAYPHELSGGMQQRVMIAMALSCRSDLLVADEPTTALDVTIQAQILDLLSSLRKERNMAIILVTHNLGIVSEIADKVVVMYGGSAVESAPAAELFANPRHPYTLALLDAVPKLGSSGGRLNTIPGSVPSPRNFPAGCRFYGRCKAAERKSKEEQALCQDTVPPMQIVNNNHTCRCHFNNNEGK